MAGKAVEHQDLSLTAAGNAEWRSHFRRQFAFSHKPQQSYHTVQQLYSLIFTQLI